MSKGKYYEVEIHGEIYQIKKSRSKGVEQAAEEALLHAVSGGGDFPDNRCYDVTVYDPSSNKKWKVSVSLESRPEVKARSAELFYLWKYQFPDGAEGSLSTDETYGTEVAKQLLKLTSSKNVYLTNSEGRTCRYENIGTRFQPEIEIHDVETND